MTDTDLLKTCPFCGGEAIAWQPRDGWAVGCNAADCAVDPETADSFVTEAEAIAAWNRRAPSEAGAEVDAEEQVRSERVSASEPAPKSPALGQEEKAG